MRTPRIPQVPSTPFPEQSEFRDSSRTHFRRSKGRLTLERYLCGLPTEHPNKNCDTIAQVFPGTFEQQPQGLLTSIDWDEQDLTRRVTARVTRWRDVDMRLRWCVARLQRAESKLGRV